jgi:cell shape-determining protein MreC
MAWKQSTFKFHNNKKSRLDYISRKMLFTWCMLISLILFFWPDTSRFQLTFASIFRPALKIGKNYTLARQVRQNLTEQPGKNEVVTLQNQVLDLQKALTEAYKDKEALSRAREYIPLSKATLLEAGITTNTSGSKNPGLIIDRGSQEKVAVNQYVLAQNSIIGTISEVSNNSARVKLLTNPDSKIGIKIDNLDIKRYVVGNGDNTARVPDLQVTHKIQAGDNVYAISNPGFLDTPMIIGAITKCQRSNKEPTVWDITVKPACDIAEIEKVIVIIMNPKK